MQATQKSQSGMILEKYFVVFTYKQENSVAASYYQKVLDL